MGFFVCCVVVVKIKTDYIDYIDIMISIGLSGFSGLSWPSAWTGQPDTEYRKMNDRTAAVGYVVTAVRMPTTIAFAAAAECDLRHT